MSHQDLTRPQFTIIPTSQGKLGAQPLIDTVDSIQPCLFGMVLEKIFIADLQKISGT